MYLVRFSGRHLTVRYQNPQMSSKGIVAGAPFGCVVVDPPYPQVADLLATLERLGAPEAGWLDEQAVVVAKHFWKDTPPERVGSLVRQRDRRFGETALSVYRREPELAEGGR